MTSYRRKGAGLCRLVSWKMNLLFKMPDSTDNFVGNFLGVLFYISVSSD